MPATKKRFFSKHPLVFGSDLSKRSYRLAAGAECVFSSSSFDHVYPAARRVVALGSMESVR